LLSSLRQAGLRRRRLLVDRDLSCGVRVRSSQQARHVQQDGER
jgi:hypothetical protein